MQLLKNSAVTALLVAGYLVAPEQVVTSGVSGDKIVFGNSAAFEDPAGAPGTGMNQGLMAAFNAAPKSVKKTKK
tara:strand:+ start:1052 stop:1273 length:222 start_codon:yes stop_codon:yes gene_type:complete